MAGQPEYAKDNPAWVPQHTDFEEMTVYNIRRRIGVFVGRRVNGHARFSLSDLNSIYAYLTGEFYVSPRVISSPTASSPPRPAFMYHVADVAGLDATEWDRVSTDGKETSLKWPDDARAYYRKAELIELGNAVDETDDQRSWTGSDGEQ